MGCQSPSCRTKWSEWNNACQCFLLYILICISLTNPRKNKSFWHQSEVRTAATVWNWSGKTLSPGALLAVLYFSSCHIFPPVFHRPHYLPLSLRGWTREWYSSLYNTDDAFFCSLWWLIKSPVLMLLSTFSVLCNLDQFHVSVRSTSHTQIHALPI